MDLAKLPESFKFRVLEVVEAAARDEGDHEKGLDGARTPGAAGREPTPATLPWPAKPLPSDPPPYEEQHAGAEAAHRQQNPGGAAVCPGSVPDFMQGVPALSKLASGLAVVDGFLTAEQLQACWRGMHASCCIAGCSDAGVQCTKGPGTCRLPLPPPRPPTTTLTLRHVRLGASVLRITFAATTLLLSGRRLGSPLAAV